MSEPGDDADCAGNEARIKAACEEVREALDELRADAEWFADRLIRVGNECLIDLVDPWRGADGRKLAGKELKEKIAAVILDRAFWEDDSLLSAEARKALRETR